MKFLITAPQGEVFRRHFPSELLERLGKLGDVVLNPNERQLTRSELIELLPGCDAVLTHWGTTQFDEELLDAAPQLSILAHCAGTVAHIASEACYQRGIHVLSANSIMADYVAEGVLGMMLCALREMPRQDQSMREGRWERRVAQSRSLLGAQVGFVGLGTVGRRLLNLLAPMGCTAKVYDPYMPDSALEPWPFAQKVSFDEALSCSIVTLHASQTPETFHIMNPETLSKLPDGALLINSARGSLVDTQALIAELTAGRLYAALDVYENEGHEQDARLLSSLNVLLLPHMAAAPAQSVMTAGIIDSIELILSGQASPLEVSYAQFSHMTQE